MFRFEKEQKVCRIGNIDIGGQPGEHPPVLIGSIFHKGDRLIESRKEGKFDKARARELLKRQEELSQQTGIPGMIDIVANSGDEFKVYIDFLVNTTDIPFGIDAWMPKPKLEAARYVKELGLINRMFYNSLTPWAEDLKKEIEEIKDIGIKHVVLIAFDDADQMPSGRLKSIEKLLKTIDETEFESILVDTSNMNLPATAFCCLANYRLKEIYGFPVGSAPANGTYMWKFARDIWGQKGFSAIDSAVHSIASILWHDFLFYGPLSNAYRIFPAVASATSILATFLYDEVGYVPENDKHPLNKLFSDFASQLKTRLKSGE